MRNKLFCILICFAGALFLINWKELNEDEYKALEKGSIFKSLTSVEGTNLKLGESIGIVDAPPEKVFKVITDYEHFTEFMPYVDKIEIKKIENNKKTVYFYLDLPSLVVADRYYSLELIDTIEDETGERVYYSRWAYVKDSGNIADTYGYWKVESIDSGKKSLLQYQTFTDPGGNVPQWIQNIATEQALPKIIEMIRKRVKHPSYD